MRVTDTEPDGVSSQSIPPSPEYSRSLTGATAQLCIYEMPNYLLQWGSRGQSQQPGPFFRSRSKTNTQMEKGSSTIPSRSLEMIRRWRTLPNRRKALSVLKRTAPILITPSDQTLPTVFLNHLSWRALIRLQAVWVTLTNVHIYFFKRTSNLSAGWRIGAELWALGCSV